MLSAQFLDMGPHFSRTPRTVQANAQRPGMHNRSIESFRASVRSAYGPSIRNGIPLVMIGSFGRCVSRKEFLGRINSRFRIQGIKDGLDQYKVRTTFHQPFDLLIISRHRLIESAYCNQDCLRPATGSGFIKGTDKRPPQAGFGGIFPGVFICRTAGALGRRHIQLKGQ